MALTDTFTKKAKHGGKPAADKPTLVGACICWSTLAESIGGWLLGSGAVAARWLVRCGSAASGWQ